jgi:hypothetical protein
MHCPCCSPPRQSPRPLQQEEALGQETAHSAARPSQVRAPCSAGCRGVSSRVAFNHVCMAPCRLRVDLYELMRSKRNQHLVARCTVPCLEPSNLSSSSPSTPWFLVPTLLFSLSGKASRKSLAQAPPKPQGPSLAAAALATDAASSAADKTGDEDEDGSSSGDDSNDFACHECGGLGNVVCCDTCNRVFHHRCRRHVDVGSQPCSCVLVVPCGVAVIFAHTTFFPCT